jgi:DNA-binding MarR family transcriptional regulator
MAVHEIPQDYALVLLQIGEDGEDDFSDLAELTQVERRRLWHVVQALQHKGLVIVKRRARYPSWISLSSKGRRLMRSLWPEARLSPGF